MNIKEYNKLYHQRPDVIEKKRKYFKEYNARPEVKQARHEWYINKKIILTYNFSFRWIF